MNKIKTIKEIIVGIDSGFDTITTGASCTSEDATDLLNLVPENFITEAVKRFGEGKTIFVSRAFCSQVLEILVYRTGFSIIDEKNCYTHRYISIIYGGDGNIILEKW